jgi:phthiocerol/phenolphthiocerol synthesis type-I polyketide synthase E
MSDAAEGIAIIGLSGRFPQCNGVAEFWQHLRDGRECIKHFSEQELLDSGVAAELLRQPNYVRANGVVEGIELFDASFFGFNPRDAEVLDPQQRMFLECAWEALEDSGRVPDRHAVPVGVFAGASMSTYAFHLYNNPALAGLVNDFQILISNDKDHLATRVAYKLNLQGPAVSVGTACSTSLVATCLAVQSLLDYQCDLALAGGVSLGVPMQRGYLYESGGISSPDGHCRPFDAAAMGTVGGNGCAVLVLKRLADALADGDPVRAVIRGFGLNNDGSAKVGYTAPSVDGQAGAIAAALAMAGVHPDTITLMEAHGTATPLGDPIELAALTQAWRRATRRQYCALGSLKSNLGHMDAAAGAAGLIKCVMALQHRQLPPSLHFSAPNPKLDLAASPFFVNTQLRDWQPDCGVRRAAVSSFGIGGTNAHLVLEEAPADQAPPAADPLTQLLPLSARSVAALEQASQRLASCLSAQPDLPLADVAHTLQIGRSEFSHRRMLLASGPGGEQAVRRLRERDARHVLSGQRDDELDGVAFLLPGQGAQHAGMARGLYRDEPVFREALDTSSAILQPLIGQDLVALIHDPDGAELLRQTQITQPAVFAVSCALAHLWLHWGVKPVALLGHSVGEYTAAYLAGVFSLKDALGLMAERGRILAAMPPGAMLAVALPEADLRERFGARLDIAAINGPSACVLAGDAQAIAVARRELEDAGELVQALQTSHAFHSRLVDAAVAPMQQALQGVRLNPPQIPCISNVSGRWLRPDEATSLDYWARHLRAPVRFADGLGQLLRDTRARLLEVGPGTTLAGLARQHGARSANRPVLSSCRHPLDTIDDRDCLLQAVARLWVSGSAIDWQALRGEKPRRRVSLPTYPFERQRYWIEPPSPGSLAADRTPPEAAGRLAIEDWLYRPRWIRLASLPPPDPAAEGTAASSWLLVGGRVEQARALAQALADTGLKALVCSHPDDLAAVLALAVGPLNVISLQGLEAPPEQGGAFGQALALLKPLARRAQPTRVLFLTTRLFAVTAADTALDVDAAGLLGPVLVAPQEYPDLRCQVIDLDAAAQSLLLAGHGQALMAEALASDMPPWLAHRGAQRWSLSFEPAPLAPVLEPLAPDWSGCYIVTGGLGRIGRRIAEFLARRGAHAIVLVGRSAADSQADHAPLIAALEALGSQVRVCAADVSIPAQADRVVALARALGERVDGVFHAAGLTGAQDFADFSALDAQALRPHAAAKHLGAAALAAALRDDPPAFFCAMSSISTVLGGLGFAAYAAANAMLDAWIAAQPPGPTRWLTINWDGWALDGGAGADDGAALAIHADEGLDVLERVLAARDLNQVLVAVGALGPRLQRWVLGGGTAQPAQAPESATQQGHDRPELSSDFVAPAPGRQTEIAGIWCELLGMNQVGAHDNFFELGGHSLLAIQVVSRLRQAVGCDIPVRMLFDHPTVAALEQALEATLQPAHDEGMARLLERIEAMSDSEVEAQLQREAAR